MKNVKRLLAALLATLTLVGLTACGGSKQQEDTTASDDSGDATSTEETYGEGYVLRVGMNCSAAPFGWTQDDDSNGAWPIDGTNQYVCGYDVQIARLICDTYGWDLKIIKTDWDGLIPGVVSGKLDCCISTLGVTEERLQSVDFSDYYWNNGCIMVVRKDSPMSTPPLWRTSTARRSPPRSLPFGSLWCSRFPTCRAEPCLSGLPELFVAVSSGKVDGIITGLSEAQSACLSNPDLTWVTFEDGKGFDVELSALCAGIPIAKGNTELKDKINAVIATLDHDTQMEMMTTALNAQPLSDGSGEALQAEETKDM